MIPIMFQEFFILMQTNGLIKFRLRAIIKLNKVILLESCTELLQIHSETKATLPPVF